mmetsp:Transcript_123114/g.213576  ORF Transcript_123114/g.213576 Transcript_123114/m.213576 type:complete len:521 (+) Transcript_123114:1-1563(+)
MGSKPGKSAEAGGAPAAGDAALGAITKKTEERLGKIAVTGRYHRLPRKIEDDYELAADNVIGKGYNGSVYIATGRTRGHKYAVKDFKLRGIDSEKKEELQIECEISLGMDHPHVVRLVDVYESATKLSLVMECMSGGELFDRVLARKKYSEKDAAIAAYQMLLAIQYLHHKKVVHRDIKLENFLYESKESDHLKLIDFGFSKIWDPDTRMKMSCGTLAYVAPEVLSKSYDSQCDVWSLGVVIFILLVGYMPFAGSESNQIAAIKAGRYTWKEVQWRRVSAEGQTFIRSMLKLDPKERLTPQQALEHPWIQNRDEAALERVDSGLDTDMLKDMRSFAEASKFRRACFGAMAWSLTNAERAQVRDAFLAMDKENKGVITIADFKEVISAQFEIADSEMVEIFSALDMAKDEQIHYSEFLAAMASSRLTMHSGLIQKTFKRFDVDGNGLISEKDLRSVLGETFEGEKVEALIAEADTDKDGKISYEEFVNYLQREDAAGHHKEIGDVIIEKSISDVATMKVKA